MSCPEIGRGFPTELTDAIIDHVHHLDGGLRNTKKPSMLGSINRIKSAGSLQLGMQVLVH
jgi:hypothetical protein